MKLAPRLALVAGVLTASCLPPSAGRADQPPTPEQAAFFEKSIRPVLVRECYSCHSAEAKKDKGGLSLDTRDGLRKGGETGPGVVPGNPGKSLIVKALRHTADDLKMPPKKKLGDDVVADFVKWVEMGAPDPRDGGPAKVVKSEIDVEKGRQAWAYQPPKKAAPPAVKDATWPKTEVDRFVLAGLEAKGLKPVADADPRALLRRLTFDLTGLPPAPDDVEAFVKAHAADPKAAIEAAADRLLASPAFGERWGRHWLDVARFAESSGRAANFAFPQAWRYRDYVIDAFNKDKPYDRFVQEQLAGDLLPAKDDAEKAEHLVATGFLAVGPKSLDERNRQQFAMDVADEQIDATFQAFQGLTVACARCHDHKFDPVPTKDYYALAGIFRSTETCYGTIRTIQSNHPSSLLTLPEGAKATQPLEPLTAEKRADIEKQIKDVRDQMAKLTGQDSFIRRIFFQGRVATLQSQLDQYAADGTPRARAMGVREASRPSDSRLYVRGELDQPGETVPRGFPQVLITKQPTIPRDSSGRKELAEWIASKENPLTARVMVNRVWLHLFGRGIVATPDNFGANGSAPSHPELLDTLAVRFAEDGWSVKRLIRTLVTSRAYRLGSKSDPKNAEADPENVLVWRVPTRRLEAEALRDSMLALGGRLEAERPKGSSVARGGEGRAGGGFRFGGLGGGDPAGSDPHRTVYLSVVRDSLPEVLTLFDFPDPSLITGERSTTTVPAQALYLLNNPFVIRCAEGMADKLPSDPDGLIDRAYRACYSRPPSDKELTAARKFLEEYGKAHSAKATRSAFCQALFASAEFAQR